MNRKDSEMTHQKILLVPGSLRGGSFNRKLIIEAARFFDGNSIMADVDLPLYNGDVEEVGIPVKVSLLRNQVAEAEAIAIATPEYNQSFSGVLKNALDWISRAGENPWKDKPVAIMSAAAGRAGGARAQYALRLALNPFQPKLLTGPEVMVAGAAEQFDNEDRLTGEHYKDALAALMIKLSVEAR